VGEGREVYFQRLAIRRVSTTGLRRLARGVVVTNEKHSVPRSGGSHEEAEQAAYGHGQRYGIVERGRRTNQGQHHLDGLAAGDEPLVKPALALRRPNAFQLAIHRAKERVAVEVLVLVEIIADAHAHGVEWRRLVGETRDHDGDDVRIEEVQVF